VADVSGNGNTGTLGAATWTAAGRYGGALSFNGSSALVTVPDAASLDLTTGLTEEAWVNPSALGNTARTVLYKERPAGMVYDLYAHGAAKSKVPRAQISIAGDQTLTGTSALKTGVWTHLAATYDGATQRLYVNGVQVAQRAQTGAIDASNGALRIGGNTILGQYFAGVIDEVRIYNRALPAAELQSDMATPLAPVDGEPPTAPQNLAASGALTSAQLSWTAATDNVGVVRYDVHRSTTAGFTPSASNRVATPAGTSYTDSGLAAGTYYYKVIAEDAAGNLSPASNQASAQVGDTSPPSAPGTLTATGSMGSATLSWGAATDNVGVVRYDVHRSTTSGFTPSATNRVATPAGTSYTDLGLAAGTYYYKVLAEDAAGNVGAPSNQASASVTSDTTAPSAPSGLSAIASGTTIALSWTASTDDVGVAGYDVHRSTTSGFTPSAANRIAQPTGTSYADVGLAPGTYFYKVIARDAAGNASTPSAQANGTVTNTQPAGLVAAYGFSEGSGTTTADQSGNGNTGSLSGTTWAARGKYGGALAFNGISSRVNIPDSTSLHLSTGMTLEGWVNPTALSSWGTVVFKERSGWYAGALYANTDTDRPSAHVDTTADHETRGPAQIPVGSWTHLAATYDGSAIALWVNGSNVASAPASGNIAANTGPLRIGGNAVWGEYFNGLIDEVRVYNRALTATEIQGDMTRGITPDATPPTIIAKTPADGAAGLTVGTAATATFSEDMSAASISSSTFTLVDSSGATVPATVTFDPGTTVATLTPQSALRYGVTYTVTAKGGSGGISDVAGNPLAADVRWSFTIEASPPQVLVLASPGNPFGNYLGEILRNEGLDAFTTSDPVFLSAEQLSNFDVVLLGETPLSATQATLLSDWVTAGGNLVAMRPDKRLAGLLGLSDAGTTLTNGYIKVDTSGPPGAGIVGSTVQFHGTADRYTLNGASAVAALYSNATTATANPAVTLRSVGSAGGQAAAFTFDLARSVVLTRQGNPAWAGQERDGIVANRPDDMFYGAKTGDLQPDWLDTSRIAIPQADEQQRLLVNLITLMERDRMPLPHFWYLPRGAKAAVVLSGDDHSPVSSPGYTASNFDRFKALSPAGCVVGNWQCVRSTSFTYPTATLTDTQARGYVADGFEVALHPELGSCPTTPPTPQQVANAFDTQLATWSAHYPSMPSPVSNRTHCVEWPDWASEAKIEAARGMRMDANWYHFPAAWIGSKPGFLNGGGFPMRFADLDGTTIDVYQQNTNMNDEAGQVYPATVDALLDNAVGPNGYYGTFGVNIHNDIQAPQQPDDAIVASAQARGVPLISYKQLLDWVDGRNGSTIRAMSFGAGTFTFATTVGPGASGLQTMLPTQGPSGTLTALTCGGSSWPYTVQTVKGTSYAMFTAITGTCRATYG
jgi:fibronectin type 3 domain-containing protein